MANQYLHTLSDVWNSAMTKFFGIRMNVTNTNSDADSRVLEMQVGSNPVFSVRRDGAVFAVDGAAASPAYSFEGDKDTGIYAISGDILGIATGGVERARFSSAGMTGAVVGNASTATSAATLTTARTLTIGSTGKSFNGSANVSWTVAEMGVVGLTGNQTIAGTKTFSGVVEADTFRQGGFNVSSNVTRGVTFETDATSPLLRLQALNAISTGVNIVQYYKGNTLSYQMLASGDVRNANNVYGAISDERRKQDIVPAGPQLDELRQIEVVKFRFKHEPESPLQIGVVAQQVQEVKPGLVAVDTDEDGTLSVKYSVLVPILLKAVQELADKVDDLTDRVAELEGA
jgi:hypothetical protein